MSDKFSQTSEREIIQVSPFMAQLAVAKEPEQTREMEALASAGMAWAKENEDYEAYANAWYAYVQARRKTTELILPYVQHGGDRHSAEFQGHSQVTLNDFGFSKQQWNKRMQELEADIDDYYNECIANGWQPTLSGLYEIVKQKNIKAKREEFVKKGEQIKASGTKLWRVWQGDIRTWQPTQQYDFIITDPPYPAEFLPLWSVLAERATEWLAPGGLLVAMSGHLYLPEIYARMSEHLDYYWTGAYWTPGESASNFVNHINQQWKPLLMWQRRGDRHHGRAFSDVFKSDANDKNLHHWGQSESGMYDIVSKICNPGQSILDPFAGAGTTLVAGVRYGCISHGIDIEDTNVSIMKARLTDDITA